MTPEDALHADVAGWLGWALPEPAWWSCFPAGGGGFNRGLRLKRLGLKAGFPDLFALRPLKFGRGTFIGGIELKTDEGQLSAVQIQTHADLRKTGMEIAVCRNLPEVRAALAAWQFQILTEKPSATALRAGFAAAGAVAGTAAS